MVGHTTFSSQALAEHAEEEQHEEAGERGELFSLETEDLKLLGYTTQMNP